jgi:hypothetical protein
MPGQDDKGLDAFPEKIKAGRRFLGGVRKAIFAILRQETAKTFPYGRGRSSRYLMIQRNFMVADLLAVEVGPPVGICGLIRRSLSAEYS